jgi:hypothetical protein
VDGTKCPFDPRNKKEKTETWFKALDIAVFVNCVVECIELYGASCSLVRGLNNE